MGQGQDRIKLWIGPRAVPARSTQKHGRVPGKPERPGDVGTAASRDGSRSGELDAALDPELPLVKGPICRDIDVCRS
jgi:hypothetical protein